MLEFSRAGAKNQAQNDRPSQANGRSRSGKANVSGLVPMRVGMMFRGFRGVVGCMNRVTVRDMGMLTGLLVVAFRVMLRGFPMMFGGVFVVLGSCLVMLVLGVGGHVDLP